MNKTKKVYAKPGIVFEDFTAGELTGTPEMVEKIKATVKKPEKTTKDIFEELKKTLGCTYISDIKTEPYCSEAKALLKTMDIEKFSLKELNDISYYLYGMQFANKELATIFLRS